LMIMIRVVHGCHPDVAFMHAFKITDPTRFAAVATKNMLSEMPCPEDGIEAYEKLHVVGAEWTTYKFDPKRY
jgi:hypothetical protein